MIPQDLFRTIEADKLTTVLIIGEGSSNYGHGEIFFETSSDDVLEFYGDSDLYRSFLLAEELELPYVFILNAITDEDYLKAIPLIADMDFSYVVFVSKKMSDFFSDEYNPALRHYYFSYLLGNLGPENSSTIVVTDKHADLYADIDEYLDDMNGKIQTVKQACSSKANLENILFVGNNLNRTRYPQLVIVAALIHTPYNKYPQMSYGESIFDIDSFDDHGDMIYFKNHVSSGATIENFVNFLNETNILYHVPVSRIIKKIKRELDFSMFKGKLYKPHMLVQLRSILEKYLESLLGALITSYEILDVSAYKDPIGCVNLLTRFNVTPFDCLEKCELSKEVTL